MAPGRFRGTQEEEEHLLLPAEGPQARGGQWYRRYPWRKERVSRVRGTTGVLLCLGLLAVFAIFVSFQTERDGVSQAAESPANVDLHEGPEGSPDVREEGGRAETGQGKGQHVNFEAPGSSAGKPNIIFIAVDDMGWNDIGYQSTDMQDVTPNLDKLAAGGVKMSQYYSMSICTPARGALMTGRYPIRYGMQYSVIQPGAPWGLHLAEKILPEYLNDAGYVSHMVGKWHLGGYTTDHAPYSRGFETFLGYLNDEEMYWTHQSWTAQLNGRKFFDFGFGNETGYYDVIERALPEPGDDYSFSTGIATSISSSVSSPPLSFKGEYSTDVFTERAMEILGSKTPHDEDPLFLYLAHQAVHDPLGLPPADAFSAEELAVLDAVEARSSSALRVRFAKVLMYLDKSIGKLVDYLEDEGWMENTIIVMVSDNGGCPSYGGSNYPLRGIKHSYWDGGNKVPALVYSPSHIPEQAWGSEYAGLMHVTDWVPTLASAAETQLTGGAGDLDGVDHWQYIVSMEAAAPSAPSVPSISEDGEKNGGSDEKGAGEAAPAASGINGLGHATYEARSELLYNFDAYNLMASTTNAITEGDDGKAQGAFRQGKWKYMFNEWCTGYYAFDYETLNTDKLTNSNETCQVLGACTECGVSCTHFAGVDYTNWLFDLEADPREENNVAGLYPELVESMRNRVLEVVMQDCVKSSYENINRDAYYVWAEYNYWMVPWWTPDP